MSKTTHFGYQTVDWQDKAKKVEAVFSSVANKYDVMNDAMSFGLHRLWKLHFIQTLGIRPNQRVLDLAGGTGDISQAILKKLKGTGQVILSDINLDMLEAGKEKITNKQFHSNLHYAQINAETLPFPDNYFDRITISFGLRNVTDKATALSEMYRVLKPSGRACILEFSTPTVDVLSKCYDFYSFNIIPKLGEIIANDKESYEYLVESIRMHPNQDDLKQIMTDSGFDEVTYENLSGGIVAIHKGFKY